MVRKREPTLEELIAESKRLRERSDELSEESRVLSEKIAAMEMQKEIERSQADIGSRSFQTRSVKR